MTRKVDIVWNKIIEDYGILEQIDKTGIYRISADEIRKYNEPRLVTKFDCANALPEVFVRNELSILPDTTGTYLLGHFDTFKKFPKEPGSVTQVSFPAWIESIDTNNIRSESIAIAAAVNAGIFADFLQDDSAWLRSTVSGRMGSGQFDFWIGNYQIHVNSSQIEIDGALESQNQFVLLEGKNVLHDDFIIRQLYYPYRTFLGKIHKPIRNVFITYSNNIYRLMEYKFADYSRYDSCEFVRQKSYCINSELITLNDARDVLRNTAVTNNAHGAPFIQCDDFGKIINILELTNENGQITEDDIVDLCGFTPRQGNYYFNGGRFLGLLDKICGIITLTERGQNIINKRYKDKQLSLMSCMLEHQIFRDVFIYYDLHGAVPEKSFIVEKMKKYEVCGDNEEMYQRRASSVKRWFEWMLDRIGR